MYALGDIIERQRLTNSLLHELKENVIVSPKEEVMLPMQEQEERKRKISEWAKEMEHNNVNID